MVKDVDGYLLTGSINRKFIEKVRPFSSAKVINEAGHEKNIPVINHSNINPKRHLNRSKLHFNNYGNSVFVKNIRNFLSNLI